MKKLFYFALAALTLAACAKEMTPENETNVPKVKVSLKAILDQDDVTKAEIDMTKGTSSWNKGDKIAVHTKNGKLATLEAETDGTVVTFSGDIEAGDEIENNAIAYYPSTIAIEGDATNVNLPASYESPVVSAKSFPLMGVLTDDGAIVFKHLGALLRITINNVPASVTSVDFTPIGDFSVSGTLAVDKTNAAKPKCLIGSSAKTSVSVSTSSADRTTSTSVFYLPLPTGTLTGGFSIVLKNGTNVVSTQKKEADVTIERAKLIKMKAFTPEGTASEWYLVGKFNEWNTTATCMTEVLGHEGWLVAKNITLPNYNGDDKGFKFFNEGTWKGGSCSALHTEIEADGSGNIDYTHEVAFDIYYKPSTNKFFIANAGEPWYRTIYLTSDMALTDDTSKPYKLHFWPYTGSGLTTTWPGYEGSGPEFINGVKYYKFQFTINGGEYLEAGKYNCVLNNDGNNSTVRYDFRDGALTVNNNDSGDYYLCFTSTTYNGDHGENNTNPMTQFTDPAQLQGETNWDVYIGKRIAMHWEGTSLVAKSILLGPSTEVRFLFNNQWNFYCGLSEAGSVSPETEFDVIVANGSTAKPFTVPSLSGNYACDIYFNPFNNKAKVVPITPNASITVYAGLSFETTKDVNFYRFGEGGTNDWPGDHMTFAETINGINFYKIVVSGADYWDKAVSIVIQNDDILYGQTTDFVTADWSGHKSEYWFVVEGRDISQLPGRPLDLSSLAIPTIDGKMADWEDYPVLTSGTKITCVKAVATNSTLYVYQSWDNATCTYTDWGSYQFLYIDRDNDASTGYTSGTEYRKGSDVYWKFFFHFSSNSNHYNLSEYAEYDSTTSDFVAKDFAGGQQFSYKENLANNSYEIEYSVPLSSLGITAEAAAKTIRLGILAYTPNNPVGGTSEHKASYVNVTIPPKD